jgi:hypothetical protein
LFIKLRRIVYATDLAKSFPAIRIDSGKPWENGYNESFNGRFKD